ncbi:MAG TPA: hypothetical protein VNB22_17540, partial [Pyrinomonadaceae bacterium]|nr:hypothetical protein [Pyrinomonadaceae bacterium]
MKRNLLILSGLFILVSAFSAAAHPLGNFSINQYSRLEVEKSRIKIRQILDLAEIPTFQLQNEIDTDKNGTFSEAELNAYAEKITPEHLANLSLTVNDQPAEILTESKNIALQTGAGNLPTLRIEWNLTSDLTKVSATNQVRFENKNYIERIGWNEIVLNRVGSLNIFDANVFGSGITDELKAYPQENLDAPLAERSALFSFSTEDAPENARILQNRDGHASV